MLEPNLLEATMVRCAQNRAQTKYDAECVNARDAVNRMAVASDDDRRARLDAEFEGKRQALRRSHEAAAEASRERIEAQRRQEEAEYLGLFEEVPAASLNDPLRQEALLQTVPAQLQPDNEPGASLALPIDNEAASAEFDAATGAVAAQQLATEQEALSDIDLVREELRRRQEAAAQQQ